MRAPTRTTAVALVAALTIVATTGLSARVDAPRAHAAPGHCADLLGPAEQAAIEARTAGHRVTVAVYDERTGCRYGHAPERRNTTASVFKISMMAVVLLAAQDAGRGLTAWEDARIRPMIAESADPPTTELFNAFGGAPALNAFYGRAGLWSTHTPGGVWGLTTTSAADQVELLRLLVGDRPGLFAETTRAIARQYLEGVVPQQRWGVGSGVPAGWRVAMKNGFFPSACCGWRLNTAGQVGSPFGGGYEVVVLSDGWASEAEGIAAVAEIGRRINAVLAVPDPTHRSPIGTLDTAVGHPGSIAVRGWAIDPDTDAPATVHLYGTRADGATVVVAVVADADRPDVRAALPAWPGPHGFDTTLTVLPGSWTVCAYGIDDVPPGMNVLLGCSSVIVPERRVVRPSATGVVARAGTGA